MVPGSSRLVLVEGVRFLDERTAVFDAMVEGWTRQQLSRRLVGSTIGPRVRLIRRFQQFTGEYPWEWTPQDMEDFSVSLNSNGRRVGAGSLRGYQLGLRQFCDYLTDRRYDWSEECERRFGVVPAQICHEWNTIAHVNEFEGRPGRRPMSYEEVQRLFDYCDDRVDQIVRARRKGALAALRDSQMIKTTYAFGLRRQEVARLDLVDLHVNPQVREWGRYGSVHVRYGKAVKGGTPRRRTVMAVPEFDWAIDGLRQWCEDGRPRFVPRAHPALWVTERNSRVAVRYLDSRFAELRAGAGLAADLTLHSLRPYVTHLIEFGYAERFVQEQVGHSSASSTAIYTSVSSDFKNRILADALARVYRPQEQPR